MAKRPMGVTIIAIIGIIFAILGILGSIASLGIFTLIPTMVGGAEFTILGALMMPIMALSLIISIISLLGFYWLLQMKKNGWTLTIVLQIISIFTGLLTLVGWIIPLIIVIYLWMKKGLFK